MTTHLRTLLIWVAMCCCVLSLQGQAQPPFERGVNLTNWFQAGGPQQIQFTKYTRTDFEQIKSLGCDVIRLPINLHAMAGDAPDYPLDPLFLTFLDSAVNWSESLGLHLILDNHTFDPAVSTSPNVEGILAQVWKQMAQHYQDRSDLIYYEVLNEPHGIDDAIWGAIQGRVIDTIRMVDTKHTIVVGPANWNSYYNLQFLPNYADTNLIYTFHFYDPFIFTHQGASWVNGSMEQVRDIPFPYHPDSMPAIPATVTGWVRDAYNDYSQNGTVDEMRNQLDIAATFSQQRNVPVFCGEFGVYQLNSQEDDRVRWYEAMRGLLDTANIAWTMWDYHGGFGLFNEGGNELFDHDLNVALLQALQLNVPPQRPFVISPDTAGLYVYRDYIEVGLREASFTDGSLNYYATMQPSYGRYHIEWEGANQYQAISFDFAPNKDFGQLATSGYALDFFVRADNPATFQQLDARFLDTKTQDPNDHPWRMNYTFSVGGQGTNGWQHYHIPLSSFIDAGSWDNNQWYNSQGLFDWQAVDLLQFVAENGALAGRVDLDHIQLTQLDTARALVSADVLGQQSPIASVYPNPFAESLFIHPVNSGRYEVEILDAYGRRVMRQPVEGKTRLSLGHLSAGVYVFRLYEAGEAKGQFKVWKR